MEAKGKILELVAAEDKILARLSAQKREAKCRIAAFENVLAATNGDNSSETQSAKKALQSKIEAEITIGHDLDRKMTDALIRKAAIKESVALFPEQTTSPKRPVAAATTPQAQTRHKDLRPQSELYQVREIIRKEGKPTALARIVEILGHPSNRANQGKYASIRGSIRGYAKRGHIFTIESKSPHVIGLLEFRAKQPVH